MLIAAFLIISIFFFIRYFFSKKNKFSFENLFFGLWFLFIGVSQFRLSSLETPYSTNFWIILSIFSLIFYFSYNIFRKKLNGKIKDDNKTVEIDENIFLFVILSMLIISLITNTYIFLRFGTMPILSTAPDKMRFIINKEIFGPIEYLAFLPRMFIPISFIYLLKNKLSKIKKIITYITIALGFIMLILYASRVIIVFPIILCYFSYLILKIKDIKFKQLFVSTAIVVFSVLFFSISIPIFRQYITYKDYYGGIYDEETGELDLNSSFSYLLDISKIKIPKQFNLLVPLYIIPSFNLQTLYHATTYFNSSNFYHGRYLLSISDSFLKPFGIYAFKDIKIQWKEIFLPWWNTGTFLFDFWADFGYFGIVLAAVFFGGLFSSIYVFAIKRKSFASIMLFAYFNFFIIMSIYTNYIRREEFYLDLFLIAFLQILIYYYSRNKAVIEQKIYAFSKHFKKNKK